jgi:hypothetical protein
MDGGIISLLPSSKFLHAYLSGLKHMDYFLDPIALKKWFDMHDRFLSTKSYAFMLEPLLIYIGNQNPFPFLSYPLAIIAHFLHEIGTNASSMLLKFTTCFLRKGHKR